MSLPAPFVVSQPVKAVTETMINAASNTSFFMLSLSFAPSRTGYFPLLPVREILSWFFDRAGRPRAATSTFDLSSLVMRSGGRYAGDEEPWLVVRDRYGSGAYFYTYGPRYFELAPNGGERPFACTPS